MDLSAIIKAVTAPLESRRNGDLLQDLRPGDKLTGKVVSVEHDGQVMVDLGRSRILAQIAFTVKPGQLLNLSVVETGPVLHFRAGIPDDSLHKAPIPKADFSQVLTERQQEQFVRLTESLLLPNGNSHPHETLPKDAFHALSQVRTLFQAVPMQQSVSGIASWIRSAVEDRGFFLEKRLADIASMPSSNPAEIESSQGGQAPATAIITRDIKAQLIILKDVLAETDDGQQTVLKLAPKDIEFLRHSVERLLGHVTQQQERAVARWDAGETQQVLVHLWPVAGQPMPMELKVYYPPKRDGAENARQHHIALLLDMDRLGPVRVDLAMIGEHLHISFFVESEAVKDQFLGEIQSVEKALTGFFQQLQVDIFVSQEKIAQFHEEDTRGATPGRIDVKA